MIYRDLELIRSSNAKLALLMRSLFMTGGKITSMFYLKNGFPDDNFSRWSTFYRLEFLDQESLDLFQSISFATVEPETITGNGD